MYCSECGGSRAGPMEPAPDGTGGYAGLPRTVGAMNNIGPAGIGAAPIETFDASPAL